MAQSITIWILIVVLTTFIHYWMISRNVKPIYLQWFVIRAIAAILHAILADVSNVNLTLEGMIDYWPLFFFQISSYYLIFDPLLNRLRGLTWIYKGKDSGWMDKLPHKWYIAVKILCIVVFGVSCIILL